MWILTLINVLGFVSHFGVRVHQIGHIEIKAYKINHLFIYYLPVHGFLKIFSCFPSNFFFYEVFKVGRCIY